MGQQFDMGLQVEPGHILLGRHPVLYKGSADFASTVTGFNKKGLAPEGQSDTLYFRMPHGETGYSTDVVLHRNSHDVEDGPKGVHYSMATSVPTIVKNQSGGNTFNWDRFDVKEHEPVHVTPYQGPEHLLDTLLNRSARIDRQVQSGELPPYRETLLGIKHHIVTSAANDHRPGRRGDADFDIHRLDSRLRDSEHFSRKAPEDSVHGAWLLQHGLASSGGVFFSNGKFNPFKNWAYEPTGEYRHDD